MGFSAAILRGLVAHEIGHNFNCKHNYEFNSNCHPPPPGRDTLIMDPVVSTSTTWSNGTQSCALNSVNTVNDYSSGLSCLYPCPTSLMDEVWVDFNYNDCSQLGTFEKPFNILSFGVYWLNEGGTINIKSSSSNETLRVEKPSSIHSWNGPAAIGHQ